MDFTTADRAPLDALDSGDLDRDLLTALGEDEVALNVAPAPPLALLACPIITRVPG